MTEDDRKALRRRKIDGAGYEVGYGKPPAAGRFKKGQSGNPRGRPKGARNRPYDPSDQRLKAIVVEEAYRTIPVRDGARTVEVPMAQAVVRSLAVSAAKGNARAQRLFTEILSATETELKRQRDAYMEVLMEYKLGWEKEIAYCRANGLDLPEPVPHPDHIVVDLRRSEVWVEGPMTDQEKEMWDRMHRVRIDYQEEFDDASERLKTEQDPRMRAILEDEVRHAERILELVERGIAQMKGR